MEKKYNETELRLSYIRKMLRDGANIRIDYLLDDNNDQNCDANDVATIDFHSYEKKLTEIILCDIQWKNKISYEATTIIDASQSILMLIRDFHDVMIEDIYETHINKIKNNDNNLYYYVAWHSDLKNNSNKLADKIKEYSNTRKMENYWDKDEDIIEFPDLTLDLNIDIVENMTLYDYLIRGIVPSRDIKPTIYEDPLEHAIKGKNLDCVKYVIKLLKLDKIEKKYYINAIKNGFIECTKYFVEKFGLVN